MFLKHGSDEMVDFLLSVSPVSIFDEGVVFIVPSTSRVVKLEGPQEIVSLLEVLLALSNLLNKVFNASNSEFSKVLLDDGVIGDGDSSSVDSDVTSLVN